MPTPRLPVTSGSKSNRVVRLALLGIWIATASGFILFGVSRVAFRGELFEAGLQAGSPMKVWLHREFLIVGGCFSLAAALGWRRGGSSVARSWVPLLVILRLFLWAPTG